MLTKQKAEFYLGKLIQLKIDGPSVYWKGICGHMGEPQWQNKELKEFFSVCRYWEHFSGSIAYPVPSCCELAPMARYHLHGKTDLWDTRRLYGTRRWELLDWLIEYWTKQIEAWGGSGI